MPEEPSHKGFTFKKWDPDPNKMDKSGETYSTYDEADDEDEKDEDQNVKVHFKVVDPTEVEPLYVVHFILTFTVLLLGESFSYIPEGIVQL